MPSPICKMILDFSATCSGFEAIGEQLLVDLGGNPTVLQTCVAAVNWEAAQSLAELQERRLHHRGESGRLTMAIRRVLQDSARLIDLLPLARRGNSASSWCAELRSGPTTRPPRHRRPRGKFGEEAEWLLGLRSSWRAVIIAGSLVGGQVIRSDDRERSRLNGTCRIDGGRHQI